MKTYIQAVKHQKDMSYRKLGLCPPLLAKLLGWDPVYITCLCSRFYQKQKQGFVCAAM